MYGTNTINILRKHSRRMIHTSPGVMIDKQQLLPILNTISQCSGYSRLRWRSVIQHRALLTCWFENFSSAVSLLLDRALSFANWNLNDNDLSSESRICFKITSQSMGCVESVVYFPSCYGCCFHTLNVLCPVGCTTTQQLLTKHFILSPLSLCLIFFLLHALPTS